MQAAAVEAVALLRHPSELLHDPAADGHHLRVGLDVELRGKVLQIHARVHGPAVGPQPPHRCLLLLVLVPDLAHQLL